MKKNTGPKQINTLFEKYKKTLRAPEATVVHTFVEVVEDLLGITVPQTAVSYQPSQRTIYIKNGLLRSAVIPHKKEVLAHLKARVGDTSAPTEIL